MGAKSAVAALVVLAAGVGAPADAAAQARLKGRIDEVYSERPSRSGGDPIVAGLMFGSPPAQIDLARLHALVPAGLDGRQLCFSATTIDGVYRANGTLRVPAGAAGLLPIDAEGFTRFARELKGYRGEQFAARVAVADNCERTADALSLPVSFDGSTPAVVRVAVHGQSQTRPRASFGDTAAAVTCQPVEGQRRAFDHVCHFVLDRLAGGGGELRIDTWPTGAPPRKDYRKMRVAP